MQKLRMLWLSLGGIMPKRKPRHPLLAPHDNPWWQMGAGDPYAHDDFLYLPAWLQIEEVRMKVESWNASHTPKWKWLEASA